MPCDSDELAFASVIPNIPRMNHRQVNRIFDLSLSTEPYSCGLYVPRQPPSPFGPCCNDGKESHHRGPYLQEYTAKQDRLRGVSPQSARRAQRCQCLPTL